MSYQAPHRVVHRVYMAFRMTRGGWHVEFMTDGFRSKLPKTLHFVDQAKLFELADRGQADTSLAAKQGLAYGIREGKGGVYLNLTDEQFNKLR